MANLKNITELPVAESADGLNLIVNDNGAAKQIAASAVGAQADWAVEDENSPAFIKNKPVEEWDLDLNVEITWNAETNTNNDPVFTANEGYSYEAFNAKFEAGEIPKVRIKIDLTDGEYRTRECVKQPTIVNNLPVDDPSGSMYGLMWLGGINTTPEIVVLIPDGSFAFQVN